MPKRCAPDVRAQAIHELLEMDGGVDAVRKLAQGIVDTKGSQLKLNTMTRQAMKPTWRGALLQMRINGMLSSPKTHLVNIVGNHMTAFMAIPERYLAAGFSKVFHGGEISLGEVNAQAFGYMQGHIDGMKLVALGKKAEVNDDVSDLFSMFKPTENIYVDHLTPELVGMDNGSALGKGMAYAGKALNVPTKMLGAADDYFKSVGYRMELNALAHRKAVGEGLEGDALADRINDLKNNPPEDLKVEAFEVARYQTFTNDLGVAGKKMTQAINSSFAMKLIFPFVRTPANILKYTFERTPLALASKAIRADIRAGGARAAQAEARIALGTGLMMWATSLAAKGFITGGGPLEAKQRRIQRGQEQPYSIKIGDRFFAFNRLDPFGMLLGLGADFNEMSGGMTDEDGEILIMAGVLGIVQNLSSKTYLSGAFDFFAAMDDGNYKSNMKDWVVGQTFTFAPFGSLSRNIAGAVDPIIRDASAVVEGDPMAQFLQEFTNSFKKNIPGLSDELPARRDLWGKEISRESGIHFMWDLFSPVASRIHEPDKVTQAILDNKVGVSWPNKTINGVRLQPEEYSQYSEIAGVMAKEQLDKIVGSRMFNEMSDGPDGMKAEIIKSVINSSRKAARGQMINDNIDLRNRVFTGKIEKQNKLLGK